MSIIEKNVTISPPWWTLYNKIVHSIGADQEVCIKEMYNEGANYYIDIIVDDCKKACALAAVLIPVHEFGNITVYVSVYDCCCEKVEGKLVQCSDPVEAVIKTLCIALSNNYYFVELIDTRGKLPPIVKEIIGQIVLVIKKKVIQFFNDDISDYYNNLNEIAEIIFEDVLITEYPNDVKLSLTTENKEKC